MKIFILSAVLCLATFSAFGQSSGESSTPVPVGVAVHEKETISSTDTQERSLQYWELNAYVFPISGVVEFAIDGRGETNVVIDGGCLSAGMYLYALVVDSKVIDTKRMILTK